MNIVGFLKGKSKKLMTLWVSVLILLTLATGIVSADTSPTPTTFDLKDLDGKYTFRITFPDGEGLGYEEGFRIENVNTHFIKIGFNKSWKYQNRVNVTIEVLGAANTDWRFYARHNMWDAGPQARYVIKDWEDTNNTFKLQWDTNPSRTDGSFYFVQVTDNAPSGSARLAFLLMPEAREEEKEEEVEEKRLELLHEPPFPYLEEAVAIRASGSMKGGELRAILKDENGKGVSGEIVHFYVEKGSSLHGTIAEMPPTGRIDQPWREIYPYLGDADSVSYIGYAVTDSEGIARLNYILRGVVRSEILAENLVKNGGKVEGSVKAVVVKKETVKGTETWEQTWKVEHKASIPVKFEYLAKVVDIWGNGVPDSPPAGKLQYVVSGPGQVRVKRSLVHPALDVDKSVGEGFELMPGDIINIDGDTGIEVVWVNGDRIRLIVPKYVDVKEKQLVGNVNMVLCSDAYNSEFYTEYEALSKAFAGVIYEEGTKTLIETGQSFVPGGQTAAKGYSYIINIIKKSDEQYGKIDLSKFSIITKIRVRSKIVVDATGDDIKIYTIEGSPDILTVKGEEVKLTSGQMVSVSKDGSLSEVQSFDTEEILNEFYETVPSTTDVTGLTFESRSKSSGSSIQIPLTLNGIKENIGNMDITLGYDPSVLEAIGAIPGGLTTTSLFDYNIMDGTIKISLADKQGFGGDGSIAYAKFNVIGTEGSSSHLQIEAIAANRAEDYEALEIQTNDGLFNVITIEESLGDCNGDGKYTAMDALCALQMSVEKIPERPDMDMNGDGSVTSFDARKILRSSAKLE